MSNLDQVKKEVMDLLNQVVIKTKGIEAPETDKEDWDGNPMSIMDLMNNPEDYFEGEDEKEELAKWKNLTKKERSEMENQVYLAGVNAMLTRIVDGDASSVEYNEKQYYNSNC
jgi:hypothetical protein